MIFHECDGRANDPDAMVAPLTPKPTLTAEVLTMAPPTIASCREEDAVLRKWSLSRCCCASCILETKTNVGSTAAKAPGPRTNPNIDEAPTTPKTHPPITRMRWASVRPRGDDRPTDTQTDTRSRNPLQDTTDHCLTSRRRRCAEEVVIVTVLLRDLHS